MRVRSSSTASGYILPLVALLVAPFAAQRAARADGPPAANDKSQHALAAGDQKLLERLTKEFVFDPAADAVFVAEPTLMRTVWGSQQIVVRNGWRVAGKSGQRDRVYFADGDSVSLPKQITLAPVDFVEACRKRYTAKPKNPAADPNDRSIFKRMHRDAIGDYDTPPLVDAVWLHKFGHDDLAALALKQTDEDATNSSNGSDQAPATGDRQSRMVDFTKHQLATAAFLQMIHAFMVNADDEAERHGRRLVKLYPKEAKRVGQVAEVMADLERRKKKGTFGKPEPPMPPGFDSWETPKKIAWLIDGLDEVQQFQMMQPGSVPLALDPRVATLIGIGNPAVPALIDAIERDTRLTRSVHFWRDFYPKREVLGVREAALTAAMSILKIQAFEARSSGDSFTVRGEAEAKRVAARLRRYWEKYGALSLDQRMMKTLADPHSSPKAAQEAAENLADLGKNSRRYFDPSGARLTVGPIGPQRQEPNPAIKKFSNPTTAEAILIAMDRDLAAHDKNRGAQFFEYEQDKIEDAYLNPLMQLGDTRIAPELERRYKAAGYTRLRRKLALAASLLGDSQPLKDFIHDFESGRIPIPKNDQPNTNPDDQPGRRELTGVISSLIESHLPEADAALFATANPKNQYHRMVAEEINRGPGGAEPNVCLEHPFCLLFLRQALDEAAPADAAAEIARMTLGVPAVDPNSQDADRQLKQLKDTLDRFGTSFRCLTATELEALDLYPFPGEMYFVPAIRRLAHPATADDVKKGRAIFELAGHGRLSPQKLPAVATLVGSKHLAPQAVLIFQAEIDAHGKTAYGIVGRGVMRAATAGELSDIKPLP